MAGGNWDAVVWKQANGRKLGITDRQERMRIGMLSDTHDELLRTRAAIALFRQERVHVIVHCGDLTTREIVRECAVLPCYIAFGNHDSDNIPALESAIKEVGSICLGAGGIVHLAGKRFAITHGHVGIRKLLSSEPDFLIHGHSHIPTDTYLGATRRICPGALHRTPVPCVAILDTDSGRLEQLSAPL